MTVVENPRKGKWLGVASTKRARSRRQVKLQTWVARQLWHLHQLAIARPSGNPDVAQQIFKSREGRPINSDYLSPRVQAPPVSGRTAAHALYDLRHTAATLALAAGVPAKVVSEQLGHASSAFTLDVYSHVLPHMQSEAAERVAALLGMGGCEREGIGAGARKPPQSIHLGQLASESQPGFAQEAG